MKWIGLTGGIASGKSTVAEIIEESGVPVVNADRVAHLALDPGSEVYPSIIQTFGEGILFVDKSIDRNKLGAIIFNDVAMREKLESLVHPFVRDQVRAIRKDLESQGHRVAVYDVPLLFEKKMEKDFDEIVLVYCSPEQQVERLMKRNALTREQAKLRLKSQLPLEDKKKNAVTVIDNSGTRAELKSAVQKWLVGKK